MIADADQRKAKELENIRLDVLEVIDEAMPRFVSRHDISAMLYALASNFQSNAEYD